MMKTEAAKAGEATGLLCGAARRAITPPAELIPDLRALRDEEFGGVLDDIFVRVIAVGDGRDKALIVVFELDKAPYPAETLAKLSERTGVPEENIFYLSVHNHTSPITGFRPHEPPNDVRHKSAEVQAATAEYEGVVFEALFEAVDEALAEMRPARMGCASGESYINVNRNQIYEYVDDDGVLRRECGLGANPQATIDHTLFALKFEDQEGRPIAFFLNYPVHCCVMISNLDCNGKTGIGGDLSGAVCRSLEGKFDGSVAVWSSGAAGDVNPIMLNEMYYPDLETGRPVMMRLDEGAGPALSILAGRHLADALKVIRGIVCDVEVGPIGGTVAWSLTPGRNVTEREDGGVDIEVGEDVDPYDIRLHLMRIGDIALFGASGELYSSLGQHIKEVSPLEHTAVINHDATFMSRCNYIFDDATLACDMSDFLPGSGHTRILPGHVRASLEQNTREMFESLGLSS